MIASNLYTSVAFFLHKGDGLKSSGASPKPLAEACAVRAIGPNVGEPRILVTT